MRRITHLTLGAAVTVPLALNQSPGIAIGCLVLGSIGGGMPDWIDFQSGFRRPFTPRHRGASHGLPVLALAIVLLVVAEAFLIPLLPDWLTFRGTLSTADQLALLLAFALGWLSHLLSDACTISGIQPLLPFARWRFWLVPRAVRSRSDGYLDKLVRLAAMAVLGFGLILLVMRWLE